MPLIASDDLLMISLIRYLVPSGKEDGTARELREDDEDDDPVHVFGQVVEGMDVVQKVEALGSQSGRTKAKVEITDCGELKAQ